MPYFEWAEKIPSDQAFIQPEDSTTTTYDVDEVEDASGVKWKLKLAQNKSFEDDIHIAGHSSRESVAKQHLVQKAKEHIEGLREKGTKVEVNTKKKIEEVDELDSYRYLVRAKRTLEDGAVAVRTKYWWEVVIVPLERTEVEARV
jgi:hypothetical protein